MAYYDIFAPCRFKHLSTDTSSKAPDLNDDSLAPKNQFSFCVNEISQQCKGGQITTRFFMSSFFNVPVNEINFLYSSI